MADLDLTNFQGFLDYEGLEYYDDKSETRTDEKIAVETERATNAEKTLTTNLNTHTSNKSNPHGVTKSQVGLGNVDNTSDVNKPISTATQTALDKKANIASPTLTGTPKAPTATSGTNTTQIATTAFVQTEIGNLINGAPETANTLKELSDLIEEHQDVTDALNAAIGTKANASDLTSHTGNTTIHITSTERTNWNDANSKKHTHSNKTILDETTASFTTAEKEKLEGIASGANKYSLPSAGSSLGGVKTGGDVTISSGVITVNDDSHNHVISNVDGLQDALDGKAASSHTHSSYANQNAFSNVKVGSTTIAADTTTDTLTLVGSNVTITPDATNDKVTIGITKDNVIAALGYTPPTTNTTYSNMTGATSSADGKAGLVPAPAKGKQSSFLRGDGTWVVPTDTKYTHPSYTAKSSGLYKVTVDATGHVSAATAVAKSDITALGIPAQDTTYSVFVKSGSGAKAGLVPAPSTTAGSTKYLCENGTWAVPSTSYTLPTASSTLGGVKTTSTVTSTSGLTACPIISGVVYYKDTNTTYSQATSSALGLVKIGYTTSGKNYAVQLNDSGQMFVNVPWSYVNTTYTAGSGISLNGTQINNSGVRSIASGTSNGTLSVNTNGAVTNVAIPGVLTSITTSLASTSTSTALAASAGKNLQDQITTLNSDLTITPITPAVAWNVEITTNIGYRYGNLCYVYVVFNSSSNLPVNTSLFSIPRPFGLYQVVPPSIRKIDSNDVKLCFYDYTYSLIVNKTELTGWCDYIFEWMYFVE